MPKFSVKQSHCLRAFLAFFLVIAFVGGLSACSSSASPASTAIEGTTIGFVGVGTSENEWQTQSEKATVAGLRNSGLKVIYNGATSLDPQAQINAVNAMVRRKVSALVISAQTTNLWNDTFVAIHNAGIPIILLGRKPVSLKGYLYDAYVGPSAAHIGTGLAEWVEKAQQGSGESAGKMTALMVQAPLDSSMSSDITQAWKRQFSSIDAVSTLATRTVVASWDAAQSRQQIAAVLDSMRSLPQIVVTYSDVATYTALAELKARGASLSATPRSGSTCVLALTDSESTMAALKSGEVAGVLSWDSDYSKPLYTTVMELIGGKSSEKDVNIPLKWNVGSATSQDSNEENAQQ